MQVALVVPMEQIAGMGQFMCQGEPSSPGGGHARAVAQGRVIHIAVVDQRPRRSSRPCRVTSSTMNTVARALPGV